MRTCEQHACTAQYSSALAIVTLRLSEMFSTKLEWWGVVLTKPTVHSEGMKNFAREKTKGPCWAPLLQLRLSPLLHVLGHCLKLSSWYRGSSAGVTENRLLGLRVHLWHPCAAASDPAQGLEWAGGVWRAVCPGERAAAELWTLVLVDKE